MNELNQALPEIETKYNPNNPPTYSSLPPQNSIFITPSMFLQELQRLHTQNLQLQRLQQQNRYPPERHTPQSNQSSPDGPSPKTYPVTVRRCPPPIKQPRLTFLDEKKILAKKAEDLIELLRELKKAINDTIVVTDIAVNLPTASFTDEGADQKERQTILKKRDMEETYDKIKLAIERAKREQRAFLQGKLVSQVYNEKLAGIKEIKEGAKHSKLDERERKKRDKEEQKRKMDELLSSMGKTTMEHMGGSTGQATMVPTKAITYTDEPMDEGEDLNATYKRDEENVKGRRRTDPNLKGFVDDYH